MARVLSVIGLVLVVAALLSATVVGVDRGEERLTQPELGPPYALPADLSWGAAVAAQQVEHQQPSDWTRFEQEALAAGRTGHGEEPGVALPGHIAALDQAPAEARQYKADFDRQFTEDLKLARQHGHTAFRFSIDWARLYPRPGMDAPDPEGLAFYRAVFDTLRTLGLDPYVTLFHFSSPAWLWEEVGGARGWERPDALEHWRTFVSAVVREFGGDVRSWCTLNEPMVFVYNGYLEGVFPPLERRAGPAEVAPVVIRLLEAHTIAYRLIHEDAAARGREAQVGLTQHTRAFEPWRGWLVLDRVGAQMTAQAFIWDVLDALQTGVYRMTGTEVEAPIQGLAGSMDYVGINYYGRFYVEVSPTDLTRPIIHPNDPSDPEERSSDLGWALYPRGLGLVLDEAQRRYGLPLYVLEHGVADAADDDRLRQHALVTHLRELALARARGVDVRGYFHWSLVDNFEWAEGFGARFGLVRVDYADGFRRVPRPSLALMAQLLREGGISAELWTEHQALPPR